MHCLVSLKRALCVLSRSNTLIGGTYTHRGDERNAISCRVRILQFGDEVRRGMCHSKENFDQILSDIDEYERYCEAHPEFKNNKTVATKEKIIKVYSERMDNNDFL